LIFIFSNGGGKMKKCFFIALLCMVGFVGVVHADPWRVTKGGNYCPFLGSPIHVVDVDVVKEIQKDGNVYYQYKFIVQRPSLDNGWGVSTYYGINYRLYYWAALTGTSPYASLYNGFDIWQRQHANNRFIVVHSLQGLAPRPEPYYIRLGIIPYPMIGKYSCRTIIKYYRSDLKGLFDALLSAGAAVSAGVTGGVGGFAFYAFKEFAMGKLQDGAIDAVIDRMVTAFGEVVALQVYAKLPDIREMNEQRAVRELKARTLRPYLHHYVPTENRFQDGRVVRIEGLSSRAERGRVPAGTKVWYSVYKYGWENAPARNQSPLSPALRAWLGTWRIQSHHTGGRFKGARVVSDLTVKLEGGTVRVFFGRPGNQAEAQFISMTPTSLTFRSQAGGNDMTATLNKQGDRIQGTFRGVHRSSGQPIYGTYESY